MPAYENEHALAFALTIFVCVYIVFPILLSLTTIYNFPLGRQLLLAPPGRADNTESESHYNWTIWPLRESKVYTN